MRKETSVTTGYERTSLAYSSSGLLKMSYDWHVKQPITVRFVVFMSDTLKPTSIHLPNIIWNLTIELHL